MKLKYLKKGDVFYFGDDNTEKEFLVVFSSETIIQIDEISNISASSMCIKKEWDYLGNREVCKLYEKAQNNGFSSIT